MDVVVQMLNQVTVGTNQPSHWCCIAIKNVSSRRPVAKITPSKNAT